ncbi:HAD family hydrolase [Candidatus Acidianus copahuensis]|nr:hypothetical protein [Candidatus Acidianus copahuensis]
MKYAVWLDGIILDIDLTDMLLRQYKGEDVELPLIDKIYPDWNEFKKIFKEDIIIVSPYNEEKTRMIIKKLGDFPFIYSDGKTKPSKKPMEVLFSSFSLDPLRTIVIGSSPLDLLSIRFYDSRVKFVCIKRKANCSKYSPYLQVDNLMELVKSLKRLKIEGN